MRIGRICMILAALVFLVFVAREIFSLQSKAGVSAKEYRGVKSKHDETKLENERLRADVDFLSRPENLEKELRARLNYKGAGEKMLIIVPSGTSTQ